MGSISFVLIIFDALCVLKAYLMKEELVDALGKTTPPRKVYHILILPDLFIYLFNMDIKRMICYGLELREKGLEWQLF